MKSKKIKKGKVSENLEGPGTFIKVQNDETDPNKILKSDAIS